jgi:hypothetical protein
MNAINRNIDSIEREKLDKRISEIRESLNIRLNWTAIFILLGITAASAIHIYYFDKSNWSLISKISVCVAPIGIWVVVEQYFRQKKNENKELQSLTEIRNENQILVISVELDRIAKFEEYEDEGDLYLVETKDKESIYLWDAEYLLFDDNEFPSEQVEVYVDDTFKFGIDKKVKCSGNKLTPIIVSGESKWTFFKRVGFPGDLQTEEKPFDKIIEEIKQLSTNDLR